MMSHDSIVTRKLTTTATMSLHPVRQEEVSHG